MKAEVPGRDLHCDGSAVIQTLAGSGDFLISCMLLKHKTKGKDVVLLDHTYECGLVVFEK